MKSVTEQSKIRITKRFIKAYLIISLVLVFSFSIVVYFIFSNIVLADIRSEAITTAQVIADRVDFTGHEDLRNIDDETDPNYIRIFNDLNTAQRLNHDIEYIYTMRPRSSGKWEFVVDGTIEVDENKNGIIDKDEAKANIGDYYDITCCEEIPRGLIEPTADKNITSDVWGSWISGYAPITNNKGQVIGIVGTDISADKMFSELRTLRIMMLFVVVITLFIAGLFGFIVYFLLKKESEIIQDGLQTKNYELEEKIAERSKELAEYNTALSKQLIQCATIIDDNRNAIKVGGVQDPEQVDLILANIFKDTELFKTVGEIRSRKLTIDRQLTNFDLMMKFVLLSFKENIAEKNIRLVSNIENWIGVFNFDKRKIENVVSMMIEEAINRTGTTELTVNAEVNTDSETVKLEIIDNGSMLSSGGGDDKEMIKNKMNDIVKQGIVELHGGDFGQEMLGKKKNVQWLRLPQKF